jgi:hypothetical protein
MGQKHKTKYVWCKADVKNIGQKQAKLCYFMSWEHLGKSVWKFGDLSKLFLAFEQQLPFTRNNHSFEKRKNITKEKWEKSMKISWN